MHSLFLPFAASAVVQASGSAIVIEAFNEVCLSILLSPFPSGHSEKTMKFLQL